MIAALRTTGHPNAARRVAIAKQKRLRAANRYRGLVRPMHWLYGQLVGFGYLPTRLFQISVGVWLVFALGFAWASGAPPIGTPGETRFVALKSETPREFIPALYSLDALLPIDLGYQAAFRPDADAGWLLWLTSFETMFGWLASLLLLSALGNLIKKD